MVPKGWSIVHVSDLFEVQLGKMLNKEAKAKGPQFKYLGNSNVKWGSFELSNLNTMFFNEREINKFSLRVDDIVMCEGGEVGRCAIWQGQEEHIYYQKALHRLRSKGKVSPYFFQAYIESIAGTKLLDDYTTRTSIAHLTREKLLALPVVLPPLPEQKKIAQILSTWDKAIAVTEKLLANSQQQKKSLMQQLLTGKKRLFSENGERFHANWSYLSIASVFSIITDYVASGSFASLRENVSVSDDEDFAHYVRQTDLSARFKNDNLKWVDKKSYEFLKKSNLYEGDILFVNIGDLGRVYYMPKLSKPATVAPNLVVLRVNHQNDSKFIYYLLDSDVGQKEIDKIKSGTGLPKISKTEFKTMGFSIPSLAEQQKIAAVLSAADAEISTLEKKIACLKDEKKALMQQLLTGKRRVKVEAEEAVSA